MSRQFLKAFADILFPPTCLACKEQLKNRQSLANLVCVSCWSEIKRNLPPFCYRCGRHLEKNLRTKNICPDCIRKELHFDRAFSPCLYEGIIKELVHEFKYKNREYLGRLLSSLMIDFIKEYDLPIQIIDFVIPVPLHKTRFREREFNQALALSEDIALEFKKKLMYDNLVRWRNTRTQTELKDSQRFLNVQDSFALTKKAEIIDKKILLIDDVLTTAATASEAAFTLKQGGASIVFVLTLAN